MESLQENHTPVKDKCASQTLNGNIAYSNDLSIEEQVSALLEGNYKLPEHHAIVKRLTLDEIQAQLDERAAQVERTFAHDCLARGELGLAELLHAICQGVVAYDRGRDAWYIFNGVNWQLDKGGNVLVIAPKVLSYIYIQKAQATYGEILALKAEIGQGKATEAQQAALERLKSEQREAEKLSKDLHKLALLRNVLTFASVSTLLGVDADKWDAQRHLLGVANAVIDMNTGKPVMPAPDQYIRTVAPVCYDPSATCPTWQRALLEICDGDKEAASYLQRALGYAITGECTESDFFVWYGKHGRNGKEFMLDCVAATLGDELSGPIEPELLLSNKSQRAANSSTEGLMVLRGRRLAWATETNEGRHFDAAVMKDLSGGHILTGRHNHGRQEQWHRTHTLFLLTNHKPHVPGGGGGAEWDRIKLVEFKRSFVDSPDKDKPEQHKKDKTLFPAITQNELPGVLNWLIAGAMEWRNKGLATPESVVKATAAYRSDEDTLGQFVAERCYVSKGVMVLAKDLYKTYCEWSHEAGNSKPMGSSTFYGKLEERGFTKRKVNVGNVFYGVGVERTIEQSKVDGGGTV